MQRRVPSLPTMPWQDEAAQYFLRDGVRNILGSVGIGVEHRHAQRITVLPGHQVGDGGFIVGAVQVGLCERRAELAMERAFWLARLSDRSLLAHADARREKSYPMGHERTGDAQH